MNEGVAVLLGAIAARGERPVLDTGTEVYSGSRLAVEIAAHAATIAKVRRPPGTILPVQTRRPGRGIVEILAALSGGHVVAPFADEPPVLACEEISSRNAGAPGTLLETSGSTGVPKQCFHAIERHLESARTATRFLGAEPGASWLLALPISRVAGLAVLFRSLTSGGILRVEDDSSSLARSVSEEPPAFVSLVPTQLERLLDDAPARAGLSRTRVVLVGGGPFPGPLRLRALDAGVSLAISYGSTETAAMAAGTRDPAVIARADAAGCPLDGREIRIGSGGEIRVRAPSLLDGYLTPEGIRDARDADGFFTTGDVGAIDDDGVLRVFGRSDDVIVSGGENIHPAQIERALASIRGVSWAAVIGVPDEKWGNRPVAFVARAPGDDVRLEAAAITERLAEMLPRRMIPERFFEMPPLPGDERSVRRELRALARRGGVALGALTLDDSRRR